MMHLIRLKYRKKKYFNYFLKKDQIYLQLGETILADHTGILALQPRRMCWHATKFSHNHFKYSLMLGKALA